MQRVTAIAPDKINAFLQSCLKISDKCYVMCLIGLCTGLRISDILDLKANINARSSISVTEKKTNKQKKILLPCEVKKIIVKYIRMNDLQKTDYLIFSSEKQKNKSLTRNQAYNSIKKAAASIGIVEKIGTHSLRKTYAQNIYRQTKNISLVKNGLNHDYLTTTLLYLIDDFNNLKL